VARATASLCCGCLARGGASVSRTGWEEFAGASAASIAKATDPADRRFIREGVSQGEVLVKIGKPDSESVDTGGGATVAVKRWVYLPHPRDPQTITTITLREGRVVEVVRQVSC
jgi:hypothetical protein